MVFWLISKFFAAAYNILAILAGRFLQASDWLMFFVLFVVCACVYTGWAITCHFTFAHNIFANYWPIFKILSLAHSADNLR